MPVSMYINFDGNCREAVTYYSKVFNTEAPQLMTFGEGPSDPAYPMPEEAKTRIMHTAIHIAGTLVMFSDSFPGSPLIKGNNMSLTVVTDDIAAITSWYNQLKEGGTVQMALGETFFSKCYGSLIDKYGIHWQFSHEEVPST